MTIPAPEANNLSHRTDAPASSANRATAQAAVREYFRGFDGLRGFSILCVVLSHYLSYSYRANSVIRGVGHLLELDPAGVDMFFILSGFLIGTALLEHRDSPNYYRTFFARRVYRILPLYYVWIGLFFLFLFLVPGYGMVWPKGYSALSIVGIYLALIQNNVVSVLKNIPWVGATWTLGVEEPFYILAPICFRKIGSKKAMAWVFGATAIFSLLFRFSLHVVFHSGVSWGSEAGFGAYFWTPSRICAPALGCLLAVGWATPEIKTWLRNRRNILYLAIPSLLCVFVVVNNAEHLGIPHGMSVQVLFDRTAIVLSALCLVAVVLADPEGMLTRFLEWPVFKRFGRISYCIYLTHWGILWLLARFVMHRQFEQNPWLGVELAPFAFLICWGFSELSWKYFEGPLVRRGQAYRYEPAIKTQRVPQNAGTAGAYRNSSAFPARNQALQ